MPTYYKYERAREKKWVRNLESRDVFTTFAQNKSPRSRCRAIIRQRAQRARQ